MKKRLLHLVLGILCTCSSPLVAATAWGAELKPTEAGEVLLIADVATMPLAQQWARGVHLSDYALKVEVRSMEAAQTPPWWQIDGSPTAALLAEPMTPGELREFKSLYQYPPQEFPVVFNAAAVIVHPENPIAEEGLSLAQIDAIFSSTRLRHHPEIRTWGDLGLPDPWSGRPLSLYGQDASGNLFGVLRETALVKGDFKSEVARLPSSAAVGRAVGDDMAGIGYVGLTYVTDDVRVVPISWKKGDPVKPTVDVLHQGRYPVSQTVRLFINLPPDRPLDPSLKSLLQYIYSSAGQEMAAELGYVRLPEKLREPPR